jgi:diguanylate cyclase (GGDEF)-like protein
VSDADKPDSELPDTIKQLEKCAILSGVSSQLRRDLAKAGTRRSLKPGDVLIDQGGPGGLYFVLTGSLSVMLDDPTAEPIAHIEAGETVGELGVLDGSKASAYVISREAGCVLAVDEAAFWLLINESHSFAINLLLKLTERLRANNAMVSDSVQKRRLYERAAMFDGLTGVHNRRWLDETLHRLVGRCEQGESQLCLALLDIDHFKRFNDTHGHDAGDHVLSSVASLLSANLRPTDLVARFGGEEFVVLFPDSTIEESKEAAERVRELSEINELTAPDGAKLPPVTISIGVAPFQPGDSPAELLKAADRAMYEAKNGGRNRVVVAS